MDVLRYNKLQPRKLKNQFERVVKLLEAGDFVSAEVKKMPPTRYYRAKLSAGDRLLFSIARHQGKKVILLLEIIYNHEYEKSRFLHGAVIDAGKIEPVCDIDEIPNDRLTELPYRNPGSPEFHWLDKAISFDDTQRQLLTARLPLIIVGGAGSGKTVLALEKLKLLTGKILYATRSAYLAGNARKLYRHSGYDNPAQEVDFLCLDDVLGALRAPESEELDFRRFIEWLRREGAAARGFDPHQLYEEFSGVLTGAVTDKPFLSGEDYLRLGIRRSIFPVPERERVYDLFTKFLAFLKSNRFRFGNLYCFDCLAAAAPAYDALFVDEVQDLTAVQLLLLLKLLKNPAAFLLCGDSNQIVHPNFFSWGTVKSLFFQRNAVQREADIRILQTDYRNARAVTELAGRLLRWKNARFGSVDRESSSPVESASPVRGNVTLLPATAETYRELDEKTSSSVRFAVLVLRDGDKEAAKRHFHTPLVFSVREAKGLEYPNIIIWNFISSNSREFDEIASDLKPEDLNVEFRYARNRDKADRSLEIFKFYINALYVAITRAVDTLYGLESRTDHCAFRLLGLKADDRRIQITKADSSTEEWRREAGKLAEQGKTEQAEQIRREVLKTVPVPWPIQTRETLPELLRQALDYRSFNRKAKQLLLDYSIAYSLGLFEGRLIDCGYGFAARQEDAQKKYRSSYYVSYNRANRKKLNTDLQRYGCDFRDAFNRTPLMMACITGQPDLAEELLDSGADATLRDNLGRTAFDHLLRNFYMKKSQGEFRNVYKRLEPTGISVRVQGRQLLLGSQSMEFFILSFMLATLPETVWSKWDNYLGKISTVNTEDILSVVSELPDFIIPAYQKKRQYISSILSKNEISGGSQYNQRLFIRIRQGHYLPSPYLQLQYENQWMPWDHLLCLKYFGDYNRTPTLPVLSVYLEWKQAGKDIQLKTVFDLWITLSAFRRMWNTQQMPAQIYEEISTILKDPLLMEFTEELLAQTDDLPPLPDTLEELYRLRGKNDSQPPLFLNRKELKELCRNIEKMNETLNGTPIRTLLANHRAK